MANPRFYIKDKASDSTDIEINPINSTFNPKDGIMLEGKDKVADGHKI